MNIEQNLITDIGLLKKGDVVITNSGADQHVFELVEDPRPSAQRHQWSGHWNKGRTRYIAVKCRRPMKVRTSTNQWNNKQYTYKDLEFRMPNENDPIEKFDFNFKNIFRIKQAAVVDTNNDDYFNCD
jgi:hypothetical protein|tara:strand:- start:651 stop:1031 length:381 start_codon:yes stop_codon:yes gene_type:complete